MKALAHQHRRAALSFIGILVFVTVATSVLLVSSERQRLTNNVRLHTMEELETLGLLLSHDVQRHEYTDVREAILQWGNGWPNVTEIRAIAPNGYLLALYESETPASSALEVVHQVKSKGELLLIIELTRDMCDVEATSARILYATIGLATLFSLLLGSALWQLLSRTTLRPLEAEITRRIAAEQAFIDARDMLEVRVEERTQELASANTRLLEKEAERRQSEEERRKMELQLFHEQKLKSLGVLAGGIAHDFNNLLVGVLANAELITLENSDNEDINTSVEEIRAAAQRAADLAKQLLAYAGRGKLEFRQLDLNVTVAEMESLLKVSLPKKVRVLCEFSESMPQIRADQPQIQQVIMNLLTNAAEAIDEKTGGTVTVRTGTKHCDSDELSSAYSDAQLPEGIYAYIEVSDTGVGMSEETMQSIFDPFFTTKFTGRGLGLAALLGIVRSHDGVIKVDSTIGKGTTVRVFIPTSDGTSETPSQSKPLESASSNSGMILLVDDEESVLRAVTALLKALGHSVITARDGAEAIECYRERENEISLVLLDLTMPKMDGIETFHELRKIRKDAVILLSSGYSEQEYSSLFEEYGVNGFIEKPYQLKVLEEKIAACLATPSQSEPPSSKDQML